MIIGWGSWRGSGASTAALTMAALLAAESPERPVWLIEADPAGGVLASRLGVPAGIGGLELVAFPTADTAHQPAEARFAGAAASSGALRLIAAPGDAFRAWSCHTPRAPWAGALQALDGPVVVDVGHLGGTSPASALLDELDVLLVVTSDDVVTAASALDWVNARGRVCTSFAGLARDTAWLVLAEHPGSPEPVRSTDRTVDPDTRLAGRLPWAPRSAAAINRGTLPAGRRRSGDPLLVAVEHLIDLCRRCHADTTARHADDPAGSPTISRATAPASASLDGGNR